MIRRTDVARSAAIATAVAIASAADGPGGGPLAWISPEIRPFHVAGSAATDVEPATGLSGDDGDYARVTYRATVRGQVWRTTHDEVVLEGGYADAHLDTDARLADGSPLPENLYDRRIGATYRHVGADRMIEGITVSAASADERPFASRAGDSLLGSAFLRYPLQRDAWLFTLSFTNDAPILNNVPIPGALYEWNATPRVKALIGLPISFLSWRPTDRVALDAAATVFGTLHAGASVAPVAAAPTMRLFARFDWGGDTWKWPDRLPRDERVYLRSARATAGASFARGSAVTLSAFGGYAFARTILVGKSITDYDERMDIDPGFVFGGSLAASF